MRARVASEFWKEKEGKRNPYRCRSYEPANSQNWVKKSIFTFLHISIVYVIIYQVTKFHYLILLIFREILFFIFWDERQIALSAIFRSYEPANRSPPFVLHALVLLRLSVLTHIRVSMVRVCVDHRDPIIESLWC